MGNNTVKNQHYIPRFYQKFWECEYKGVVWSLDKELGTIRRQAIKTNCCMPYTYEADNEHPDNAFEGWYGKFESKYCLKYKRLIDSRKCLNRVSDEDKRLICLMYAHFSARDPHNVYYDTKNHAVAAHFTLGIDNAIVDRKNILNIMALGESGTLDEESSEFAKELRGMKVRLLFFGKNTIFFPDHLIKSIKSGEEYFFPMCPDCVAHFSASEMAADGMVRKMSEEEYNRFENLYYTHPYVDRVFSSDRETLERIKDRYITISIKAPGLQNNQGG